LDSNPPPEEPQWTGLAFREGVAPPPAPYAVDRHVLTWSALAAMLAAWLWVRDVHPEMGLLAWLAVAGVAVALFAAAGALGYAAFRLGRRREFIGPATMVLAASAAIAIPFAHAQWRDHQRPGEDVELIEVMRESEAGLAAIAHGTETDAGYADRLLVVTLRPYERLYDLRHYRQGPPLARLEALHAFHVAYAAPLIDYQVAANRWEAAGGKAGDDIAARLDGFRAETAVFLAAGDALRARWKDLPAQFERHLASAPFDAKLAAALRAEYAAGIAPIVAPLDQLVVANAQVARANLEIAEVLAANRGHWTRRADGGIDFDSQGLLERVQDLRARSLHACRNARIAYDRLADAELANRRRIEPGRVIVRDEDFVSTR
jgi:hypothetical protein